MPSAESVRTVPDLVDPATHAEQDLGAVWRGLRAQDPVHWHPETAAGPGFWVVSRYADVLRALRDDAGFSSRGGNVLETLLAGGDMGADRMLPVSDGPRHAALRRVLLEAFSPRALAGVAEHVRAVTARLVRDGIERGGCDFAADIASQIPLETICGLLDVPEADRPELLMLTKSALASDYADPEAGVDRRARSAIMIYFHELVEARRRNPGTDPISLMAAARIDGQPIGDEDIVLNCYSLIIGGDETSRLSMIGAAHALAAHPEQWAALKSGAVSVESATEEVLRWSSPTTHIGRTATAPVSWHGSEIAAGDRVTLWTCSANRDEAVFADPDTFDLARTPNKHLAFGHGRHYCLGAYLGRVEIGALLEALRAQVGGIEQTAPERRIYSNFLSGMSSLPVALSPDPRG